MKVTLGKTKQPEIIVAKVSSFKGTDLTDLCDATESTISDDSYSFSIGLEQSDAQMRSGLEAYWKGTLLVPERVLIVGRLDGVIAASIQLIKPAPNNKSRAFAGTVDNHFVAPWARGYGLAKELLKSAEKEALAAGLSVLKLSVRANMASAIRLYESLGYKRWGTLEKYERIDGKYFAGYFYSKDLKTLPSPII